MKKYNKDYKLVTKLLQNGKVREEVIYNGEYYLSGLSKTELIKKKVYCLALALCSDIILIGVGFINTSGSRVFYVALPYAGMFLPAVFCLMGAVRFLNSGNKLEYAAYDKSRNRTLRSAIGQIVLGSMAIIGDICYLIFTKNIEKFLFEIVFLGGIIFVLILSIILLRVLKMVPYAVEKPVIN